MKNVIKNKRYRHRTSLHCDLCGAETTSENSKVYDLFFGDGLTHERHCSNCRRKDNE